MVYAPVGRAFKVRMDKITGGNVKAWWFNPRTGVSTEIGEFDNKGEIEFILRNPVNNSTGFWFSTIPPGTIRHPDNSIESALELEK